MKSNLIKLSPLTGQPGLHFWTVFGKATFMIFSQLLLAPCWAGNPKDSIPCFNNVIFLFSTQLSPNTCHH